MFLSFSILIVSLCIVLTVACGDVLQTRLSTPLTVAIVDNATHALVGCLSWLLVILSKPVAVRNSSAVFREIVLCGVFAALIDLDHFVSAASWKLVDATHLKTRPFLHNTSLILGIFLLFLVLSRFSVPFLSSVTWIFLTAGISHHIRDATRRGIWLWPFGSTPPIPYPIYVGFLAVFPIFVAKLQGEIRVTAYQPLSHVDLV